MSNFLGYVKGMTAIPKVVHSSLAWAGWWIFHSWKNRKITL